MRARAVRALSGGMDAEVKKPPSLVALTIKIDRFPGKDCATAVTVVTHGGEAKNTVRELTPLIEMCKKQVDDFNQRHEGDNHENAYYECTNYDLLD